MTPLKIPVNISNDLVAEAAIHCAPCPPVPNGSVAVAAQFHPPGFALLKNKLTRTVRHKGMSVVQAGHDIGPLMPHVTFPLVANPWYVKIWPGSSCKVVFAASTVKMNGKPVGMAGALPMALPMLTCAFPVPMPAALPLFSSFNTVTAGMTPADRTAGVVSMVLTAAVEGLMRVLFPAPASDLPGGFTAQIKAIALTLITSPVKNWRQWLAKTALGAACGFFVSSLTGNPTGSVTVGSAAVNARVTVTRDPSGVDVSLDLQAFGVAAGSGDDKVSVWGEEL